MWYSSTRDMAAVGCIRYEVYYLTGMYVLSPAVRYYGTYIRTVFTPPRRLQQLQLILGTRVP